MEKKLQITDHRSIIEQLLHTQEQEPKYEGKKFLTNPIMNYYTPEDLMSN